MLSVASLCILSTGVRNKNEKFRNTFLRKKENGPDCTVSGNYPSSVTLYP